MVVKYADEAYDASTNGRMPPWRRAGWRAAARVADDMFNEERGYGTGRRPPPPLPPQPVVAAGGAARALAKPRRR